MAVAGPSARGGVARLRNVVEQAFAFIDVTPPWLDQGDALSRTSARTARSLDRALWQW